MGRLYTGSNFGYVLLTMPDYFVNIRSRRTRVGITCPVRANRIAVLCYVLLTSKSWCVGALSILCLCRYTAWLGVSVLESYSYVIILGIPHASLCRHPLEFVICERLNDIAHFNQIDLNQPLLNHK